VAETGKTTGKTGKPYGPQRATALAYRGLIPLILPFFLSGCILFEDSYEPPDMEELSPSSVASSTIEGDSTWYNSSMFRPLFGDFKQTDSVYVTDPDAAVNLIRRGEYLVKGPAACGVCHAKAGDDRAPLSGGRWMKDSFGKLQIANITPAATGIKGWNVFEIMRAIRASIDRAGRPLSLDAHQSYRWLSDQDAKAMSLYLLSLNPVENEIERRRLGGFERNRFGIFPKHSEVAGYIPAPAEEVSVGYGRYMATTVSGCAQCHTAGGVASGNRPFSGFYQSGGFSGLFDEVLSLFDSTPLEEDVAAELLVSHKEAGKKLESTPGSEIEKIYDEAIAEGNFPVGGPNIRGTSDAGLKSWSEENIVNYLSSGITPSGEKRENRFCPWNSFSKMNAVSKQAIARYLKSL